jgi:hypothetical protein
MIPGINAWARTDHFIFNEAESYGFLRMTRETTPLSPFLKGEFGK